MKKSPIFATALFAFFTLSAQATEKFTVLIDWFVNPVHANMVVAKQKGFFEKHGLDVTLVEPTDPAMPPKLLAAGQGDLSMNYQPNLFLHIDQGLPLVRVGTLVPTPFNSLAVLKESGINDIADLKGKKIGFSVSGFEDAVLGAMLKTGGLTPKDVQLVNVNWALSQSLLSHSADAVIGAYRNFEQHELRLEGHEAKVFLPEEYGVPAYEELILVAHKDRVNDPKIKQFLDALEEATAYMKANPEQAWQDFVSYKPKELNTELNHLAWNDTYNAFADNPRKLDRAKYEVVAKFMFDNGLIKRIPALNEYAIELSK